MARQKGVFKASGRLDDFSFTHGPNGFSVGLSRFLSKDRIKTEAKFARTRENMIAFGAIATILKALRGPLAITLKGFTDRSTNPRLSKLIRKAIKRGPGDRNRQDYEVLNNAMFLKDFELNGTSSYGNTMIAPHSVTINAARNQADLLVPVFNAENLPKPKGATHFSLYLVAMALSDHAFDPDVESYLPLHSTLDDELMVAQTAEISLSDLTAAPITLTAALPTAPTMPPTAGLVVLTGIRFYQQVNGKFYTFSAGDCMRIHGIF